jgi:hypothetical protein
MSTIPLVWVTDSSGMGMHSHGATEAVLRVYLHVPSVPAGGMLEVAYPLAGLHNTDLCFAGKLDVPQGDNTGIFVARAQVYIDQLSVRYGNLAAAPSVAGDYTLYGLLIRPGPGGLPLQIDLSRPLAPFP